MSLLGFALVGYLVGSIPFALLVSRRLGGADLREAGSGNVGASNVLRIHGAAPAALAALLDIAKGALPPAAALVAGAGSEAAAAAGLAAVCGHVLPVWLRFRGGKGVATTFGACLVWSPVVAGLAFGAFLVTVAASRLISLGSIVAAVLIGPLAVWGHAPAPVMAALFACGVLVVVRHQGNLGRIVAGTERRIVRGGTHGP